MRVDYQRLPLTAEQTAELVELLKASSVVEAEYCLDLFKTKSIQVLMMLLM